jgi:hypothetical protein
MHQRPRIRCMPPLMTAQSHRIVNAIQADAKS